MSVTDELVKNSEAYAASFDRATCRCRRRKS
jgi:hypothetical protein